MVIETKEQAADVLAGVERLEEMDLALMDLGIARNTMRRAGLGTVEIERIISATHAQRDLLQALIGATVSRSEEVVL